VIIEQRVSIPAPAEKLWALVVDVPAVSRCVPGVGSVERIDDDTYTGTMKVKVGPISLSLEGKITVAERDRDNWQARMELRAADKRISGSVSAKMTLRLEPKGERETDVAIHTDAAIMGKLGEFGQPVMRKKADQIVDEFARCLAREVGA
jgi:carbon monoxide dehydrogenase subunit G